MDALVEAEVERAVEAALELFGENGAPEGTPQDASKATYAPKLTKSDGLVRFDQPAISVARRICGMTPWPGSAARYHSADGRWENVVITRARAAPAPSRPTILPGTIDERRYVAAEDGFVELLEIKPSSGRIMTWADYVNGRHVSPGDVLSTSDA